MHLFSKLISTACVIIVFSTTIFSEAVKAQIQLPVIPIGIDKGTQNFLQGLPEEVRKQLFKLLQDSLPLIDKSVDKYLKQIDDTIKSNVDYGLKATQCTTEGIAAQLKDSIKSSLVGSFFRRPEVFSRRVVYLTP